MGGDAGELKKEGTWVRGSVGAAGDRKERKGATERQRERGGQECERMK